MLIKDPHAILDFPFNWSSWLADGETISSHVVTPDAGITKDSDNESAGIVTAWISGGTAGTTYSVACLVNTTAGRTDERTIKVTVENR